MEHDIYEPPTSSGQEIRARGSAVRNYLALAGVLTTIAAVLCEASLVRVRLLLPDYPGLITLGIYRPPGPLAIEGRRLDGSAGPLRAHIPKGYGDVGFQVTGILFAGPGCWEVTGRVGDATLSFVTLVVKTGEGPGRRCSTVFGGFRGLQGGRDE